MIKKVLLLLFLFQVIIITGFSQINKYGQPFYTNYTIKEYNANSQNWAIAQDSMGIMYFGNNDGVLQYDGNKWELIKINTGAIVRSLAIDNNGIIYVGAENEFGFIKPDPLGKLYYTSLSDSLQNDSTNFSNIEKIYITDQRILFCAFKTIFKYHNKKISIIKLPKGGFFTLKVDNNFYMGDYYNGLMQLKDTTFITCKGGDFYAQKDIYHIIRYNHNELLIQTLRNGLFFYNTISGESKLQKGSNSDFLNNYITEYFLRNVIPFADAYIVNTCFGGSLKVDSLFKVKELLDKNMGLQDDRIAAAAIYEIESATNPLWLAMMNGISKIEYPNALRFINEEYGLEDEVLDIIQYKGRMYFATINGVYVLEEKNDNYPKFSKLQKIEGECWSMVTIDNMLIIGGEFNLYVLDNNKIKTFETNSIVTKVYESKYHNKIFVGVGDGIYMCNISNGEFAIENKIKIKDRIYDIIEDSTGNIWLTTGNNELIKVSITGNDTIVKYYNQDRGFPQPEDLNTLKYHDDIYFSTKKGLFQYNNQSDSIISPKHLDSLLQNELIAVNKLVCKDENIWLISYHGKRNMIKQYEKNNKSFINLSTGYKRLPESVINTIFLDTDNILWIATSEGLFTYNPNTKVKYDDPFHTLIRKVYIGQDSIIYYGNRLVNKKQIDPILDYGNNGITFHYSATSYIEESENQYSYVLEGFNEATNTWSNWSTETKKEYTNLREGKYTFKVKARNIYDNESSIATYSFEIEPPWYRTIFAYIGYFVLLVILIYIIVKLNIRRLQADKERLEGIVKERTAEVVQQKDKILKQHVEITSSIKYAKRIQRALLPPDKLMHSRLPNHFVLFKPRDVVSGDFYWMKQEGDLTLITAADCTGHGVPGAFMSMLGMAFLNEIVKNGGVLTAGKILTKLRQKVKTSLRQTGKEGEAKDGMDIAFCVIDQKTRNLQFAGAYNPLFLIRSIDQPEPENMDNVKTVSSDTHTLYEIKADKMPIGIHVSEKEEFTNVQLNLLKNDTIYMFSDGYADQIGGPKNRKFMSKHFKSLLLEVQKENMEQQKNVLNLTIENWKGTHEQVDDIVLIGIKT